MSGLAGWFGKDAGDGERTLARMGDALRKGPGLQEIRRIAGPAGLVACGRPGQISVHQDGSRLAAVEGDPNWSDPELAALAAEQGHATAVLHGFIRSGRDVLDKLRGFAAVAVLDVASGK